MKTKHPLREARHLAKIIMHCLAPACERIEIAGSIRRGKAEVGDIELVAVGRPVINLLGEPTDETEIDWWLRERNGITIYKNGPRYKQFYAARGEEEGIQVDLFLATAANWGYILMLRTGPAEFGRRMVTPRAWGGLLPPDIQVHDGQVWRGDEALDVPDEETLFALWGTEYIAPEART